MKGCVFSGGMDYTGYICVIQHSAGNAIGVQIPNPTFIYCSTSAPVYSPLNGESANVRWDECFYVLSYPSLMPYVQPFELSLTIQMVEHVTLIWDQVMLI